MHITNTASNRRMRECLCGAVLLLVLLAGPSRAEVLASSADSGVWQASLGIGSQQSAEIILNNRCDSYAQMAILMTDGTDSHEETRELSPWTYQILPFIEGGSSAGPNIHLFVRVTLSPGPCAAPGAFQASVAIVNPDESTASEIALAGDPGDEAQEGVVTSTVRRLGPWQTEEITVWNGCPVAITATLETRNLSTGENNVQEVDIEPFGIGVMSATEPSAGSTIVSGMEAWAWRKKIEDGTTSDTDPCPPGQRPVAASESLVNADGSTASASGLPTGKRQHKPVSVTKPL